MSKLLRSFQALALLELIAFAGVAMAQQDGSWCGPAEASLRSAARGDTYHRAIRDLVGCPVSGPQALAAQWAHPPEDTVALQILGDASATLRDRRLLRAATSAALNTSNRREVRLTAIQALLGQFHPSLKAVYRTPAESGLGGVAYVMLAEPDHRNDRPGAEPLPPSAQDDVLNVLRQLSSDQDEVIRKISDYLVGRLPSFQGPK